MQHFRHARAPNSEHEAEEFVRKRNRLRIDPILGHQYPTATTLEYRMQPVAGRGLHRLREKGCLITKYQRAELGLALGFSFQLDRFDPIAGAVDLNVVLIR